MILRNNPPILKAVTAAGVPLGKEDTHPLPLRKTTGPAMGLLHSPPVILLVVSGGAPCWAAQPKAGHRFQG